MNRKKNIQEPENSSASFLMQKLNEKETELGGLKRELEIEAALERVRAKTMAMKRSEELADAASVLFKQLRELGGNLWSTGFVLIDDQNREDECWMSNPEGEIWPPIFIPNTKDAAHKNMYNHWVKGGDYFSMEEGGKILKDHYSYLMSLPKAGKVFHDLIEAGITMPTWQQYHAAYFKHGYLLIITLENYEDSELLIRFAKVFDQTYTRFLDLQKAEEQAREAQIEAALERVRARAMGMHSSEELLEVANQLYKELYDLGVPQYMTGFVGVDEPNQIQEVWVTAPNGERTEKFFLPLKGDIVLTNRYNSWKKREPIFHQKVSGKALQKHMAYVSQHFGSKEAVEIGNQFPDLIIFYCGNFSAGYLHVLSEKKLDVEQESVFLRFTKVFAMTYRRFLDLKKAEAQARESQIEASLERIRAKAMAMHSSEDISDATTIVFSELEQLGIRTMRCGIGIMDDNLGMEAWTAASTDKKEEVIKIIGQFDMTKHPALFGVYEAWKNQQDYFSYNLFGKDAQKYYDYVSKRDHYLIPKSKSLLEKHTLNVFNFPEGGLFAFTQEPLDKDSISILQKFTSVFSLTYRRFQDLKKAEEQAREAQIEAALERVRARSMAMQSSEELSEVAYVLFEKLKELGVQLRWCWFSIFDEDFKGIKAWYTDTDGQFNPTPILQKFKDFKDVRSVFKAWKDNDPIYLHEIKGPALVAYVNELGKNPVFREGPTYRTFKKNISGCLYQTCAIFKQGYIGYSSFKPRKNETLQFIGRFAKSFEQTYTRFLDLQKVETQAREAQIEAALERVRTRSMAMHNSDELADLSFELVKQVHSLGIDTWFCAFNIYDEDQNGSLEWGSNLEGTYKEYRTPREGIFLRYYKAGQRGETLLINEIGKKECPAHYDYLCSLPGIGDQLLKMKNVGISFPTSQIDHVAYFKYGYILFITFKPVPEAHDIFKRFAKVFEQTYTRFLDLQKAEAQVREAQIEAALERVRSKSIGMQKSEELKEVIRIIFDQLALLDINAEHAGIVVDYKAKQNWNFWIAETQDIPSRVTIPYLDSLWDRQYVEAKDKGKDFFTTQFNFEEKNRFYQELLKYIPGLTKKARNFYLNCPGLAISTVIQDNIGLYIENFSGTPYSDDENNILMRFGKVFQQTYTRFLDLQKAEAQVREAQIEAALERVRSRSMAMHKTEELREVINTVFDQFEVLDINLDSAHINIFEKNSFDWNMWIASGGADYPQKVKIPYINHPDFTRQKEARQNEESFYTHVINQEEKNIFFGHFFKHAKNIKVPKKRLSTIYESPGASVSATISNHAAIVISKYNQIPFSEEENQILQRIGKVFEQTYTRFLDLQKAEEQAREAQIEAGLERVRASTMAMHKSEQLSETAMVLFDQFYQLGQVPDRISIAIFNPLKECFEFRVTDQSGSLLSDSYDASLKEPTTIHKIYKAWKNNEKSTVIKLTGQNLNKWIQFVKEEMKLHIDEKKIHGRRIHHAAFFSHGFLLYTSSTFMESEFINLLVRFASVFDQTYTRFLDLKKAEEQVREAQIEAALERVRSHAMALRNSTELRQVISVIFQELTRLGLDFYDCNIIIADKSEDHYTLWGSELGNVQLLTEVKVGINGHPVVKAIFEEYKNGIDYKTVILSGQKLKKYQQWLVTETDYKNAPKAYQKALLTPEKIVFSRAFMKHGLLEAAGSIELPEDQADVLMRFAKVVDLTYTRFDDLVQAEAQAREAQIETALEKVRARSMGMHHSDELQKVINLVLNQFLQLGISMDASMINIIQEDTPDLNVWIATPDQEYVNRMHIPIFDHPINNKILDPANKNFSFSNVFDKKTKNSYFKHLFKHSDLKHIPEQRKKYILARKGYAACANFKKYIALIIIRYDPVPFSNEESSIVSRFAQVFDQTYTRFLDLKKAETQAREAQIEAALERVRAQAMAMQQSDDITKSTSVLFEELEQLNLSVIRCGIGIINPKTLFAKIYSTTKTEKGENMILTGQIDLNAHPAWKESVRAWKSQELSLYVLEGDELLDYYKQLGKHGYKLPREILQSIKKLNKQYYYNAMFSHGGLYVISNSPISDENLNIIRRFTDVYNLTYTRYEDLQKAESRALEAVRQAALDRVRGVIASMRSKEDLNRITPLIWKELKALDVPFIRCGVFIMDVENETIQSYLSTPDGKTLGIFNLPFISELISELLVDYWEKGKVYKDHWTKKQFVEFMQRLKESGQLKDTSSYQGAAAPPDKLDLHFIPFKQGMLYVGNTESLTEDELDLVKSLAEAFSIAYARYEDFRELEIAKNQIEETLNELKATQSQLIHAEKMASLGELTAGIAHEIQNPLNFVNNFSDVSIDLIEELKDERNRKRDERDESLEKEILDDVIQNLEKINHHGLRASSIVKGMLEHSRSSSKEKQLIDINALADEYLRLAYHGLRAKDKSFNADFSLKKDDKLPEIKVIPQDIGRVLLNLINNAFYAVSNKAKEGINNFKPQVIISTRARQAESEISLVEIRIKDNGNGIPKNILDKIFQPFFTTKPTGQGTGLGLSLSYDIVKAHGGELKVETKENEGTEFIIQLPIEK